MQRSSSLSILAPLLLLLAVFLLCVSGGGHGPSKPKGGAPVFVHDAFSTHAAPKQIHLALVAAGGVRVSWATKTRTRNSVVRFSLNAHNFSNEARADAPCEQYDFCAYTSPWFHHVLIDGERLLPSTTYFYQCGDPDAGWSKVLSFTTALAAGSHEPISFAVIGDLGQTKFSEQTLRHLSSERHLAAILHAGDLSYADSEQPRWDRWGRLIEPLASRMPWMVAAGNHEQERPCQAHIDPFVAYQVRFRMPFDRADVSQRRNLFYAFRAGLVHVIVLTPYVASDASSPQYAWLAAELRSRVNRSVTPWLCVIMHGPWYNSNTAHQGREPHMAMKTHMEDLLYDAKADLVISGHVHAYERSFPVYREKIVRDGPVYWVVGDGGNREGLAPTYIDPQPVWSAFRQAEYGFGLFHIVNQTHARIEWHEDRESGDAVLRDSAWLSTSLFRASSKHA